MVRRLVLVATILGVWWSAIAMAQETATSSSADLGAVFLKEGILGAIIVALGIALIWQTRELNAAKDGRTEDAKKVASMLLDLQQKWNDQVQSLSSAIDKLGLIIDHRDDRDHRGRG